MSLRVREERGAGKWRLGVLFQGGQGGDKANYSNLIQQTQYERSRLTVAVTLAIVIPCFIRPEAFIGYFNVEALIRQY